MRPFETLHLNDGGEPVARQPPTDSDISEFESEFSITIPSDLLLLLRYSNGGHPEADTIFLQDSSWAVDHFYHLTRDKGYESLWRAAKQWLPILGGKCLPFAQDGGGNQFYLDLAQSPPPVMLYIHDAAHHNAVLIADSFESFINALRIDDT